ncbi:MAG: CHASE domain-containing protein [Pseudomonadota bacterium]|nr:hypothetical protein [Pseudomonadales bacterium]MDY6922019.1 CHASE domain-containing protein [Pseudomonadota bacterium]
MNQASSRRWYAAADLLHNAYTAWVVLLLSLVVTLGAYLVSSRIIDQRQQERFQYAVDQLEEAIHSHLSVYEQVLRSTVAMVYASEELKREEFATYVRSLELDRYWPGIQGIGYSIPLQPSQLAAHEAQIRSEGFPEYQVKPPGAREVYTAIVYLEPFDWRNRRAFGYDMYSNPVRREAMDRARRTGRASTSGKITLVQETDQDVQAGFLTYLPVYTGGRTPATEEQRLEQFRGWIYAPFRAGNLMQGVLGNQTLRLHYNIYDGDTTAAEALLFSNYVAPQNGRQPELILERQIELQGRPWTLQVTPAPGFANQVENADLPKYVAIGGITIDTLLFYVILSLHFIRRRAERLAQDRTRELQATQADLERQQAFANVVIDSLPLVLVVKDYQTDAVMRINVHARRLFGVEGSHHSELLSRFMRRVENHRRVSGMDQRADYMAQLDVETEAGIRWFAVNSTTICNAAGEAEYGLCTAIDNTERLESEKRFTTLFDSAPSGLMLVRSDQVIQLANRALCDLFGYTPEEITGQHIGLLVPQSLRARHEQHVKNYIHSPYLRKMSSRSNLRGVAKDGRELVLDIALQPLPFNEHDYVLVSVNDITEQHQLMEELARANRYKSEFLASMSHELRTPLNSIIGFTERIHRSAGTALLERDRDALETVRRNAHHLLALINDILDLSKVESGRMELDLEQLDVVKLLDVQLQVLAPSAKAKGLRFEVRLPEQPIMMLTDRAKLIQIMNNLVSNAVKYTHEGKVEVRLALNPQAEDIELEVTDTGIGIAEVDLRSLFKEFVRVKEARLHSIQGTGLGLAISSRLARLLGGDIEARSQHGIGSTFTVRLPLQPPLQDET